MSDPDPCGSAPELPTPAGSEIQSDGVETSDGGGGACIRQSKSDAVADTAPTAGTRQTVAESKEAGHSYAGNKSNAKPSEVYSEGKRRLDEHCCDWSDSEKTKQEIKSSGKLPQKPDKSLVFGNVDGARGKSADEIFLYFTQNELFNEAKQLLRPKNEAEKHSDQKNEAENNSDHKKKAKIPSDEERLHHLIEDREKCTGAHYLAMTRKQREARARRRKQTEGTVQSETTAQSGEIVEESQDIERLTRTQQELFIQLIEYTGSHCLRKADENGKTPLHYAMKHFNRDKLLQILDYYVDEEDLKMKTNLGNTVAHYAVKNMTKCCSTSDESDGSADSKKFRIPASSVYDPKEKKNRSRKQHHLCHPFECCKFSILKSSVSDKEAEKKYRRKDQKESEPKEENDDRETEVESETNDQKDKQQGASGDSKKATKKNFCHPFQCCSDCQLLETTVQNISQADGAKKGSQTSKNSKGTDENTTSELNKKVERESKFYAKLFTISPKFLSWTNISGQAVFHLAAKHANMDDFRALQTLCTLDEKNKDSNKEKNRSNKSGSKKLADLQDFDGNYYYHYAVANKTTATLSDDDKGKFVELLIGKNTWKSVFKLKNNLNQTVLQHAIISRECEDELLEKIISRSKYNKNQPETEDSKDALEVIKWSDNLGNTALIYAVKHRKYETAKMLFELTATQDNTHWNEMNHEGQTALHLAFEDPVFYQDLEKTYPKLKDYISKDSLDGAGRGYLFYACMGWNLKPLEDLKRKEASNKVQAAKSRFHCTDIDGHTLLHALFFISNENKINDEVKENFFKIFHLLLEENVDINKENDLGQNCLHASLIEENAFVEIIEQLGKAIEENSSKEQVKKTVAAQLKTLMVASNGFHAVHSFANKYELKKIIKPLATLCDMQEKELLRIKISKGPLKGATCLHLACQTTFLENIFFLVKNGLQMSDETYAGQTCLAFAHSVKQLESINDYLQKEAYNNKTSDNRQIDKLALLRLCDPPSVSLKLPQRSRARQILAARLDRTKSKKNGPIEENDHKYEEKIGKLMKLKDRNNCTILFTALDLDSTIIYRSALRLRQIDHSTEAHFFEFVQSGAATCAHIRNTDECNSEWNACINRKQFHPSSEMLVVDIALELRRLDIIVDLILTRQFELIPVCLSLLLQLKLEIAKEKGSERENLRQLKAKVLGIVVNTIDELYSSAERENKMSGVLMSCIRGCIESDDSKKQTTKATGSNGNGNESDSKSTDSGQKKEEKSSRVKGPKFPCRFDENHCEIRSPNKKVKYYTIYKMVKLLDSKDLFATECLHKLVRQEWDKEVEKFYLSAKLKYWLQLVAFLAFLMFFAWYIVDFNRTFESVVAEVIMASYLFSFTVQEAYEIYRGRSRKITFIRSEVIKFPSYFRDQMNLYDFAAILFMWIGLLWKWAIYTSGFTHHTAYACQMVLSTSFLLYGFRSVSFLSYFESIGPVITMIRNLLVLDLLPFLAILAVIFYSFSVFFFNLLFPVVTSLASERTSAGYGGQVLLQIFTLPFTLFLNEPPDYDPEVNGPDQKIGVAANEFGNTAFSSFFVFFFLILVNVVMVNILIALFSLRVNTMVSQARCIWRRNLFHMMEEFRTASPVPPPLSFLFYLVVLWQMKGIKKNKVNAEEKESVWWKSKNGKNYPKAYLDFLYFQATHLRSIRSRLLKELEQNRSDFDGLKAFTSNSLAVMQRELEENFEKPDEEPTSTATDQSQGEKELLIELHRQLNSQKKAMDDIAKQFHDTARMVSEICHAKKKKKDKKH